MKAKSRAATLDHQMASSQPTFRSVKTKPATDAGWLRDEYGKIIGYDDSTAVSKMRALAPQPRWHLITPKIAFDCEFQNVLDPRIWNEKHQRWGKQRPLVGRLSFTNYYGEIIYDVFAYYTHPPPLVTMLPPRSLGLGVYWPDIKPKNGARPIEEVEQNVRDIIRGAIVVGHAIHNDIGVLSQGMFDEVAGTRDTQQYSAYREYGGRMGPKLSVLTSEVLGRMIQGAEHSSAEDGIATMDLYKLGEAEIEAEQRGWKMASGVEDWSEYDVEAETETDYEAKLKADMLQYAESLKTLPLPSAGSLWQAFRNKPTASQKFASDSSSSGDESSSHTTGLTTPDSMTEPDTVGQRKLLVEVQDLLVHTSVTIGGSYHGHPERKLSTNTGTSESTFTETPGREAINHHQLLQDVSMAQITNESITEPTVARSLKEAGVGYSNDVEDEVTTTRCTKDIVAPDSNSAHASNLTLIDSKTVKISVEKQGFSEGAVMETNHGESIRDQSSSVASPVSKVMDNLFMNKQTGLSNKRAAPKVTAVESGTGQKPATLPAPPL